MEAWRSRRNRAFGNKREENLGIRLRFVLLRQTKAKRPRCCRGIGKERDFPAIAGDGGAANSNPLRRNLDLNGGGLPGIGVVGLEELFQFRMAQEANARLRDGRLATGLGVAASESDDTSRCLDAQKGVGRMAHDPKQADEPYAWNEKSHAQS